MHHHNGDHNQSAVYSASSLWLPMDDECMKNSMKQPFCEDMNAKEGVVS